MPIALAACLAAPLPAAASRGPVPPLRVAQVLLFEGKSLDEVAANLRRLRDAGVDTVFVRVFQNYGDRALIVSDPGGDSGVYFRTEAAPVIADYLGDVVPLCRRLGLSVYAWMTTRRCDWLLAEAPEAAERYWDADTGTVLRSRSLNIFHPVVRRRLLALYRDLGAYDIDGILLQDDLIMRTAEGFSPEAVAAALEETGRAPSPERLFRTEAKLHNVNLFSPDSYRPAFWDWATWKSERLMDFGAELAAAARQGRPGLRVALNLSYESVINPRMALAWYAQEIEEARRGPFDYFCIMSYHRQIQHELSLTRGEALGVLTTLSRRAAEEVGDPSRVIMKVQTLDWQTRDLLPAAELDRALAAAAAPVPGVGLAFVRSAADPPLDVIARHFGAPP